MYKKRVTSLIKVSVESVLGLLELEKKRVKKTFSAFNILKCKILRGVLYYLFLYLIILRYIYGLIVRDSMK